MQSGDWAVGSICHALYPHLSRSFLRVWTLGQKRSNFARIKILTVEIVVIEIAPCAQARPNDRNRLFVADHSYSRSPSILESDLQDWRDTAVCAFFTFNSFFYRSTSGTPSASFWHSYSIDTNNVVTKLRHGEIHCNVVRRVDNAMSCHRSRWIRQAQHTRPSSPHT